MFLFLEFVDLSTEFRDIKLVFFVFCDKDLILYNKAFVMDYHFITESSEWITIYNLVHA